MVRSAQMDHSGRGVSTACGVIDRTPGPGATLGQSIQTLRTLALTGLASMYDRAAGRFVFRVRRTETGTIREGLSTRYTAITAIGLVNEDPAVVRGLLEGDALGDVTRRLVAGADQIGNLGDLALTAWAGRATGCDTSSLWNRIAALRPDTDAHPTVEVAWTLSAAVFDDTAPRALGERLAERLRRAFSPDAGLFPHQLGVKSSLRAHVSCFADFVYPTMALAQFGAAFSDRDSIVSATRAAETMSRLQGPNGQWWWHFDCRTGRVVEPYPVYAVHQDAMAPMAFFAVADAIGRDYNAAIDRGLEWLWSSPELRGRSLVDADAGLIWRKVARREPAKLSRGVQALASRLSSDLRAPGLDQLFPPTAIDYEDRPYHLGWILYAWPPKRASAWERSAS
jgi:hypothetical protein